MTHRSLRFLLTAAFLVLSWRASAAITLTNCATGVVTKNLPCEISLTSTASPGNPYRDYTVTATFSNATYGKTYTVLGFYDGGSSGHAVFKVRFNPQYDSTWTYSISSSPADAGLTRSGSFNANASTQRGFLRRSGNFQEDYVFDNGNRIFLWGMTYYQIVNTSLATGPNGFWKTTLNTIFDSYAINKVRLLAFPWWDTFSGQFSGSYVDSVPFFSTGCSPDPRVCLNHDSVRVDHFRALDDVINHLQSKGMIAELLIFKDHARLNNQIIDGQRTFGNLTQDKRYAKYVLARYAAFPNVTWCLTNEYDAPSMPSKTPYWDTDIGGTVRQNDPYFVGPGGLVRLSSIHAKNNQIFQFYANRADQFNSQWAGHAVLQYHNNNTDGNTLPEQWGYNGVRSNLILGNNMPVANDEYGYVGNLSQDDVRRAAWGVAVAGGYGTMGDTRPDPVSGAQTSMRAVWVTGNEGAYNDTKLLIQFFGGLTNFFKMRYQDGVIASGDRVYAGGETGVQYVIYDANGGAITVNLPQPTGGNLHYSVQQYDPRTGVYGSAFTIGFGNGIALSTPAGNDYALLLKAVP